MAMHSRSQVVFRVTLLLFALTLAAFSLWSVIPELARSTINRLPTRSEEAVKAAAERTRAGNAARMGALRGDLWAESAFAYATSLWPDAEQEIDPRAVANDARAAIEKALALAPHEPGVWLLAAGLGFRFGWPSSNPTAALKMAYYTGPNDFCLIPLRLFTAVHSDALNDGDIQQLVRRDVRMILTRWHKLKPTLTAAYQDANPEAKRFLEHAVEDADRSFLASLRAGTNP